MVQENKIVAFVPRDERSYVNLNLAESTLDPLAQQAAESVIKGNKPVASVPRGEDERSYVNLAESTLDPLAQQAEKPAIKGSWCAVS